MSGPCEQWTTPEAIQSAGLSLPAEAAVEEAIAYASEVLYYLSRQRFPGVCDDEVRPCVGDNRGCGFGEWSGSWGWGGPVGWPIRLDGRWVDVGFCASRCNLSTLVLSGPVVDVSEVIVDGQVLDPSNYQLQGRRSLVRLDGGRWPCSQDFTREPPQFVVTYRRGAAIPRAGRLAAAYLSAEVAASMRPQGACECQLPEEVQSVIRAGVQLTFERTAEVWKDGVTGIRVVDLWLAAVNSSKRRAGVFRADDPRRNLRLRPGG